MRQYFILILILFFVYGTFAQGVEIGDKVFSVDTLQRKHEIGQGTTYASYSLPNYPLLFYVLEIDLTNPYVNIETCLANDSSLTIEAPTGMIKRHDTPEHKIIAGTNGDFYFYQDPVENGIPRSGQFQKTECTANPTGRASFVLGADDTPYIDRVDFNGILKTADKTTRIHTVNMLRLEAEPGASFNMLTLYTSTFGHVTGSLEGGTKVIIRPKDGDRFFFSANKDIECVVEDIFPNAGTSVIPEGWAVLHGRGTSSDFLQNLKKGDKVTINLVTNLRSAPGLLTDFKELVGGSDNIILRNGEKAEGDLLYNPRTGIGISKDKTKVFLVVADGRNEDSKGATMVDFGQIFKTLGAWDAVNMDGGGSSVMVVDNQVVNSPSDGYVRPVGTGLLIVETTEPGDKKVQRMEFKPGKTIELPVYGLFKPVMWGYNKNGILVSKDFKDFTLSCSSNIGHINSNGFFVASDEPGIGTITATFNGESVTKDVAVQSASIQMRLDSILADKKHPYFLEIEGYYGAGKSMIDPEAFTWTVEDPSVCSVENGMLTGLTNGTTYIDGLLNDIHLSQKVTVEIPEENVLFANDLYDISSFKVKSSYGINETKLTSETLPTTIKYRYIYGGSVTYIEFSNEIPLYSIPDSIKFVLNTGEAIVAKAAISLRANNEDTYTPVEFPLCGSGKDCTLSVAINHLLDKANDRASYPAYFEGLRLLFDPADQIYNKTYEIAIKEMSLIYGDITVDIDDLEWLSQLRVYPNPVVDNNVFVAMESAKPQYVEMALFTMQGQKIRTNRSICFGDEISFPLNGVSSGCYLMRIDAEKKTDVVKLIIQ